jgi:2,3-bisphosphoglycerate-dependent phosphoglycerate mutase
MNQRARLIVLRHGESEWYRDNRFTGWADVDLTEEGVLQMRHAALALRDAGIEFNVAYASVLRRCIRSLWILLEAMECTWIPQTLDWRLNERHYGALTGLVKSEAQQLYGKEAVFAWRRGYDQRPPALDDRSEAHIVLDRRYAVQPLGVLPVAESLQQTVVRVQQLWQQSIVPALRSVGSVMIVGHGNSLRALAKILEELSDTEITHLEVDNGAPIVYELDDLLRPLRKRALPVAPRRTSEIL